MSRVILERAMSGLRTLSRMTAVALATNAVPVRLWFKDDDPGFTVLEARASFAMSELWEMDLILQHQDALLTPVHWHPLCAVTVTGVPVPPAAAMFWLVGAIV